MSLTSPPCGQLRLDMRLVLLGDPQQPPHVSQAVHPPGTSCSVLEHLLGDEETVPPDRGLFLDRTWRMHPALLRGGGRQGRQDRRRAARRPVDAA